MALVFASRNDVSVWTTYTLGFPLRFLTPHSGLMNSELTKTTTTIHALSEGHRWRTGTNPIDEVKDEVM